MKKNEHNHFMPQAFRLAQSGRSMVEMLGVLAIIGVLSVGAIGGYSYAMDKYRANTIMNDVMLRAVDAIAQFDRSGDGDVNLDSWPTTTAGGYAIGLEDKTIGIQVDNIPERICEMVFDGMINNATIKIGTTEYDSATDDNVCGETNTMVFYVDEIAGSTAEKTTTTKTETTTTAEFECNCGAGQYCADMNSDPCAPTPSGQCIDASTQFKEVDIDGTTYYISNNTTSWWDAQSACEALGNKKLLTVEDIVIRNDDDTTGYLSNPHTKTALGEALYNELGDKFIWSSILDDSCYAFIVGLTSGNVSSSGRSYYNGYFAVCQ